MAVRFSTLVFFTTAALILHDSLASSDNSNLTCLSLKTCENCASNVKCYWCTNVEQCYDYEWERFSTYFKHCSWGQARWKHCWLNVMALVIASSVIGFIILVALIVVCCWCRCKCRQRSSARMAREEAEMERREEERKIRTDEKKAERSARANEVRQKYGLLKEDD